MVLLCSISTGKLTPKAVYGNNWKRMLQCLLRPALQLYGCRRPIKGSNGRRQGTSPRTTNKMIPGTKKLSNGDLSKIDNGSPPNNFPE